MHGRVKITNLFFFIIEERRNEIEYEVKKRNKEKEIRSGGTQQVREKTILEVGALKLGPHRIQISRKQIRKYKGLWKLIRACKHSYDPFSNQENRRGKGKKDLI